MPTIISFFMELKELQKLVLEQAKAKGWGTTKEEVNFAEKIALLHQEVSEALDAYRKSRLTEPKDSVQEELADVIMRALQLAGIYNLDLEKQILSKLEENKGRDWSKDQLHIDNSKRGE